MIKKEKIVKFFPQTTVFVFLLLWAAVLLSQKIALHTADLGRHIMNGQQILAGNFWAVTHTNFYSFTQTSFPFVNHHWGTGVVFYLLWKAGGFNLLSVFNILVNVAAFAFFFRIAQKQAGSAVAAALAVLFLPIITSRTEVRPEGFTYLFSGIFFWFLWQWTETGYGSVYFKKLWLLPVLMLLWVNLHIGFIVGIGIVGLYWGIELLKCIFKKPHKTKALGYILLTTIAGALINPWGPKGLLYPLNIFRSYGYRVLENQSVLFIQRLNLGEGLYLTLFEVMLVLAFLSFIPALVKNWKKVSLVEFLLLLSFGLISFNAVRNFPLFGLFAIPIMARNLNLVLPKFNHLAYRLIPACMCLAIVLGSIVRFTGEVQGRGQTFGIGLDPGMEASADFFKSNHLAGPIFNNYDLGGYLIFNLFPQEKVFVDNRPEAYSVDFFTNTYVPSQENEQNWAKTDAQYNFNAIYFSYHDYTPWAQTFLINRIEDPTWAPVFVDSYNIIFLKRNQQNADIIKQYELPKSMFGVGKG